MTVIVTGADGFIGWPTAPVTMTVIGYSLSE